MMINDPGFERVTRLIDRVNAVLDDATYGEMLHVAAYLIRTAMAEIPQENRQEAISGFTGAATAGLVQ